jgi:hypothetical protein
MNIPDLKTYDDGRKPVKGIYSSFIELQNSGWILDVIAISSCVYTGKKVSLPIIALKTPDPGKKALWLIAGMHGEEPAGPNAISDSEAIESIKQLGERIPVVLLPLCNPLGYLRNWRYLNQEKWDINSEGKSVGDSEHYLPDLKNSGLPRRKSPSSPESEMLTGYVVKTSRKYSPIMSFDFHEDDLISKGYVYSQGRLGYKDDFAKRAVKILLGSGIPIQTKGKTRFGEKILNGVVGSEKDGSIDELLSTEKIIVNNKMVYKPAAKTSIVIETPAKAMSLDKRKFAHLKILTSLNDFV